MSEQTPASATKAWLVIPFLSLMFVAGLALVYVVDDGLTVSTGTAVADETTSPDPLASLHAALAEQETRWQAQQQRIERLEQALRERAQREAVETEALERRIEGLRAVLGQRVETVESADEEVAHAGLLRDYAALGARFTPRGALVSLGEERLRFAPGAAELPEGPIAPLTAIAEHLQAHPELQLLLSGHTDASGDASGNLVLSQARAAAVAAALVALGVESARITVEGVGSSEPLVEEIDAASRARNRRVEVYFTLPGVGEDRDPA
ncbi:OmpA family protein [Marichromatium sp. AB32]|uniref:OmpA family protein n=1 Tax=Marichromatium sp. AB32 TaxID=2483363 RepID=UPI000F3ED4E0|nr:OmpA family protein [Marichromatium sp. AB32]RNE94746.1 hypothetical protein EBL85_00965 [Marichromatium sp. AB32]